MIPVIDHVREANNGPPTPLLLVNRHHAGVDIQRLQHSLDSSVYDNTRAMYASVWRSFEKWGQARGVPPPPAPPELVAAYLLELAEERQLQGS